MDLSPSKDYADQIKRLGTKIGLTQNHLAEGLDVSFPMVNRWENAKSRPSQLSWNSLLQTARKHDADSRNRYPSELPISGSFPLMDFAGGPDVIRSIVEGDRLPSGHLATSVFASDHATVTTGGVRIASTQILEAGEK